MLSDVDTRALSIHLKSIFILSVISFALALLACGASPLAAFADQEAPLEGLPSVASLESVELDEAIEPDGVEQPEVPTQVADAESVEPDSAIDEMADDAGKEAQETQTEQEVLVTVQAEETQESIASSVTNDELFAGYVEEVFYGEDSSASLPAYASIAPLQASPEYGPTRFSGGALTIYNLLKAKCKDVADGKLESTEFSFDNADWAASYVLTEAEFGGKIVENGSISDAAIKALDQKTYGGFTLDDIVRTLLVDCPYELYWFDKAAGWTASGGKYMYSESKLYWSDSVTVSMYAAQAYSKNEKRKTYLVDTAKTAAASNAAENAYAIISECEGLDDISKLQAYKTKICDLVGYNSTAANDSNTPYGDPWQIIYVFDNDPSTNVVCEGYAKAFKFLCDKSSFTNNISCYITSGYMDNGAGHMWNTVVINGVSYLVDVTNCDTSTIGAPNGLLLRGGPGSMDDGFTVSFKRNGSFESIVYTYEDETKTMYAGTSILSLAPSLYYDPVINTSTPLKDLTYGYSASEAPTMTVTCVPYEDSLNDAFTYQWFMSLDGGSFSQISGADKNVYTVPEAMKPGSYRFYCAVSVPNSSGGKDAEKNSQTVALTVRKLVLEVSGVSGVKTTKPYDGTTDVFGTPVITLSGLPKGYKADATWSSIAYDSSNTDASRITISGIKLTGPASEYYELDKNSLRFTGSITSVSMSEASIELFSSSFVYKGVEFRPAVTVTHNGRVLDSDIEYSVSYADNMSAGVATVTIMGLRGFSGTKSATFTISPAKVSAPNVIDYTYTGASWPGISDDSGYKALGVSTAVNVGTYDVSIFLGDLTNYAWEDGTTAPKTVPLRIVPRDISEAELGAIAGQIYTGSAVKPKPASVTYAGNALQEGTDYALSYKDNVNAGTATAIIAGMGNYAGTVTRTFTISRKAELSTTSSTSSASKLSSVPADTVKGKWVQDKNGYWFDQGKGKYPKNSWQVIGGKYYHFDKSGYMQTGWQKVGKKWYLLGSGGDMKIGWQKSGGAWYYLEKSGAMKTGWLQDGKRWYYFGSGGAMKTGWQKSGKSWYYFKGSGAMAAGEWVGNYYLQKSGAMATSKWIGKYHVNASGVWDKTK